MRVLILITKSNWGGAQRYVYDLATNLLKKGYEVEVMAGGNGPLIEKLRAAGVIVSGELPVINRISLFKDLKDLFKLRKIIKNKKPDILHINSSKIGGLGSIAGRLAGVKRIIFTAHGWAFNEDRTVFSKAFIMFGYWLTIRLAHSTIAVSEALKYQVRDWPGIENKIVVIHNGIDATAIFSKVNARSELAKIHPRFGELLEKNKNVLLIGGIGELHPIKGYEYAIPAIANLSTPVLYVIIGAGTHRDKLEKKIADLKLDNVLLLGHVDQAHQYLKAFDIYLLPSVSEGFPYVALEAGLASLPIVATAVGGIPEIIDDMKSGVLIQPRKPREIQNALEFYINHKKIQKEHALAIRTKILNSFSIDTMVDKTIQVYSSAR